MIRIYILRIHFLWDYIYNNFCIDTNKFLLITFFVYKVFYPFSSFAKDNKMQRASSRVLARATMASRRQFSVLASFPFDAKEFDQIVRSYLQILCIQKK